MYDCTPQLVHLTYKFTGKDRDPETGFDSFGARYYSSSMGRFTSPDWSAKEEPVPYASMSDPQSLNLYTYVGNRPVSSVDPDGHDGSEQENGDRAWLDEHAPDVVQAEREGEFAASGSVRFDQEAQQQGNSQNSSQPAPTGEKGKPSAPPVPVPGCPECGWKWNPDDQNPRGGTWGPSGWKGPNPPRGSWDPDGHWDIDPGGKGPRSRYRPDGTPVTPEEAHPGNAQPMVSGKHVVFGVGLGVGGYITYRVIRMLPSLAPPLWETIPANLAIP